MDNSFLESFAITSQAPMWTNSWFKSISPDPVSDLKTDLPRWRTASRFLHDSTSIVRAAVKNAVSTVVGKGLNCRPRTKSLELRQEILTIWDEWTEACHIDGQQDLASVLRSITAGIMRDGDILVYLTLDQKGSLKVDLIDGARIEDPPAKLIPKGRECYLGVQVNKRFIEGYWVKNSTSKTGYTFFPTFDDAGRIKSVLLKDPTDTPRVNSFRGVPIIASCIGVVEQLDKFLNVELQASILKTQQFAVLKTGSVTESKKSLGLDPLANVNIQKVDGTNMLIIKPTDDFKMERGSDISNPSIDKIVKNYLNAISGPFGIPYNILFNQMEDTSYSTNSTLRQVAWEATEIWRDYYIRNLLKPVFKLLMEANGYGKEAMSVEFNGRPITPIRQKDVYDAQSVAIQTGQKSIVQVCNENGWDAFQTLEEQLDYEKAKQDGMKSRGLELEPIPDETK